MFSQTVEYALRAVVHLAAHPGQPCVTAAIARGTQVPAGYLAKVLQQLGRAGLVVAQRGLHGGFTLGRPANGLTVLDVVNAVEPLQRIRTCPLGLKSHGTNLCPLHRQLDAALAHVEQTLARATIAQLLHQPGASTPLCEVSPPPRRPDRRPRPAPRTRPTI